MVDESVRPAQKETFPPFPEKRRRRRRRRRKENIVHFFMQNQCTPTKLIRESSPGPEQRDKPKTHAAQSPDHVSPAPWSFPGFSHPAAWTPARRRSLHRGAVRTRMIRGVGNHHRWGRSSPWRSERRRECWWRSGRGDGIRRGLGHVVMSLCWVGCGDAPGRAGGWFWRRTERGMRRGRRR